MADYQSQRWGDDMHEGTTERLWKSKTKSLEHIATNPEHIATTPEHMYRPAPGRPEPDRPDWAGATSAEQTLPIKDQGSS